MTVKFVPLTLVEDPDERFYCIGCRQCTKICAHGAFSFDETREHEFAGGRVRERAVEIGGSVFRPIALPQRLDELLDTLKKART